MPDYRRWFVSGGSIFFTVVVHKRRPLFADARATALLGNIIRDCLARWPVTVNAMVLLPDHLHAIWTLPAGDAEYPKRWGWIKKEFTKGWLGERGVGQAVPDNYPQTDNYSQTRQAQPDLLVWAESPISAARKRDGRRGVWQPRYWEHTLESEGDFERHFDYIHWNPVKHGHVRCPYQWPHSSFHRYVERGVYDRQWGCFATPPPASFHFDDIVHTTGE